MMREIRVADATDVEPVGLEAYPGIIGDLREAFLCAPTEGLVNEHVANMLVVHEATRFLSRDSRRKRRGVILGSALGIGALMAGTGAAAAAGRLPDDVQDVVATVTEPFGIEVPTSGSDSAPGHGGDNPGHSEDAPGQQKAPGNSENAPGHGGENPGRSETAPGHTESTNNAPEAPPGLSEETGNAPDVPPGRPESPPPSSAAKGAGPSVERSDAEPPHGEARGRSGR
jgi:hypothetical protein